MKKLRVYLSFSDTDEIPVGELAEKGNRIYFQYNREFLETSLWVSPYKLPLRSDLFKHNDVPFVMELPPYRIPTLKNTVRHMWHKGQQYLKKMGGSPH